MAETRGTKGDGRDRGEGGGMESGGVVRLIDGKNGSHDRGGPIDLCSRYTDPQSSTAVHSVTIVFLYIAMGPPPSAEYCVQSHQDVQPSPLGFTPRLAIPLHLQSSTYNT